MYSPAESVGGYVFEQSYDIKASYLILFSIYGPICDNFISILVIFNQLSLICRYTIKYSSEYKLVKKISYQLFLQKIDNLFLNLNKHYDIFYDFSN